MPASADYFDGRTSKRHAVTVDLGEGMLHVTGDGVTLSLRADAVHTRPRVAGTPLRVELPDGGLLVGGELTTFGDALPSGRGRADRLESHPGVVLLAMVAVGFFAWVAYRGAIPRIATLMARRFPAEVEQQLGRTVMDTLDRRLFAPSALDEARRGALTARFEEMRARAALPYAVLSFRDGQTMRANAFALPGGSVVMTDELAEGLTDDQVMAVLAHELGHVEGRHALRALFQNSALAVGTAAVFGDAGAVAILAGALPMLLVQTSYSRAHEREADAFALAVLRGAGLSPRLLGDALEAIAHVNRDGEEEWASGPLRYLSTHPAHEERIRAAREAAEAR